MPAEHTEEQSTGIVVNGRLLFIVFFVLIHLMIASQVYWLSKDILLGDGSSSEMTIPLRYPTMRIPPTPIALQHQAQGRLCADFAQIYFPSQQVKALKDAYAIETTIDPWNRPSRYPPLIHFISAYTLCLLPYGQASFVHLAVQAILFIGSFIFVFFVLKITRYLLPALLLLDISLFLTPVGLSFFERGQFTLYVGLCYLWLMLALVTGKWRYVVVSALFGFVKWTAFPFAFVACAVSLLTARNIPELKQRGMISVLFFISILLMLLMLPNCAVSFLQGLFKQEAELTLMAMGNALVRIVPLYVVKSVPLVLMAIGFSNRFSGRQFPYLSPFFAGAATILVTYPTFAFDYSVPYLTAFIPFIIYWAALPGIDYITGWSTQILFYGFLLLASFAYFIFDGSETAVIMTYLIVGMVLMGVPFAVKLRPPILENSLLG
ncbi:hypothetical protein [Geotalea sp. SG265]|uniref:hypothetical protein n=1 Tax=Geotalea sp. SG265 TaxID=2922867 RepID=UPI001FAEB46A|nr:hypothetical protein [Geotalea sp. SG265]